MNRDKMIEDCTKYEAMVLKKILEKLGSSTYLESIFKFGFDGFVHMSDEELIKHWEGLPKG